MNKGIHCVVSGRVQGVWYRASTRNEAVALGLTGAAINLPDGRVAVSAYGEEKKLEQLAQWLWQGPELAEVSDVDVSWVDYQDAEEFEVG